MNVSLIGYWLILGVAVIVMLLALGEAIRLRRLASGGKIGGIASRLLVFIVVFLGGYLVAPFFPYLPSEAAAWVTAFVFLAGAIFVLIVLRLLKALVQNVFDELKM